MDKLASENLRGERNKKRLIDRYIKLVDVVVVVVDR